MILCFRRHAPAGIYGGPLYHGIPIHRPGDWLICGIVDHLLLLHLLLLTGLLCADTDGGVLYWRACFWRPSFPREFAWQALKQEIEEIEEGLS